MSPLRELRLRFASAVPLTYATYQAHPGFIPVMRLIVFSLLVAAPLCAQQRPQKPGGARPQVRVPDSVEVKKDLDYVGDGNPRQKLDVVLPKERAEGKKLPLIVFIHGGGWRNGSRDGSSRRLVPFVESGNYVGASINYRLTGESSWPTQIHD